MLFLLGTLVTNVTGWQATPFFVWGMYSEKESNKATQPVLKIRINDSLELNPVNYSEANRFFLTSPLQLYIQMKKNEGEDPTKIFLKNKLKNKYSLIEHLGKKVLNGPKEYTRFLEWYKRYLEQTSGIKIHAYTIELLQTGYSAQNKLEIYSTELIETWRQ